MFKRTLTLVAGSLAIAGFAGAAAAAEGNAAEARYQARFLGNDVAYTGVKTVEQSTSGPVRSAYATYLIRNGESESAAVARAAQVGEQTRYSVALPAPMQLGSVDLHQKMLGRA